MNFIFLQQRRRTVFLNCKKFRKSTQNQSVLYILRREISGTIQFVCTGSIMFFINIFPILAFLGLYKFQPVQNKLKYTTSFTGFCRSMQNVIAKNLFNVAVSTELESQ